MESARAQREESTAGREAAPPRHDSPAHVAASAPLFYGNSPAISLHTGKSAQAKLEVSQPDDPFEQEADRVAGQVMSMSPPISLSAGGARAGGVERAEFHTYRRAYPTIAKFGGDILQRVAGDVLRVNNYYLTLFLSSYESGSLVPQDATRLYLTEPNLLAMAVRLRDAVLANRQAGRAPLTLQQLLDLAATITPHRGTMLLLAHNVTKGFARGSAALSIARLTPNDYYLLFSPASFGRTDTGDWYHYFVVSLPAFYFGSGAVDMELPTPTIETEVPISTSARRGMVVGFSDAVRTVMRDPAVTASPGYDGWLAANALSFLEGGFFGHDQAEVVGESRIHVTGARTGLLFAGQTAGADWKWYVPIVRGIGDPDRPDPNQLLANFSRMRNEGIEPFTHQIWNVQGQLIRRVHNTVPPPPRPPAQPDQPPPPPETPPSPPPRRSGGIRDIFSRKADDGAPGEANEDAFAGGVGVQASALAGTVEGSGGPLDEGTRAFMESRFGRDFRGVRIHTDGHAARSARAVNALAYTVGRHVVFGAGQYDPGTSRGRFLLAHELVHVVQQEGESVPGQTVRRVPGGGGGGDETHGPLLEEYRRTHGEGPGGVDPQTGQQVGPTDAELKYSGALSGALPRPAPLVRGPGAAPTLAQVAPLFNVSTCGTVTGGMPPAQAATIRACITHSRFVNHMNQSVANIRQVSSPYATGLATLYASVLQSIVSVGQTNPPTETTPKRYTLSNITVAISAAVSLPVPSFTLVLEQTPGNPNGSWNGTELTLNELSGAALTGNQQDIERTMYHEGFHYLSDLVAGANRAAAGTSPPGAAVSPELDPALLRPFQRRFETAVTPFWDEALRTHSTRAAADIPRLANAYAGIQWTKVANEILSRVEETVYLSLRAGRSFTETDFSAMPQAWLTTGGYWPSIDISEANMQTFLNSKRADINANVLPLIQQMQRAYLALRPSR